MTKTNIVLPVKHLSIRIPWHDSGWNGTVCKNPSANSFCTILERIRVDKDAELEEVVAGKSFEEIKINQIPPCMSERVSIMAPNEFTKMVTHPYIKSSPETHSHLKPTPYRYPSYSASTVPFRWMSKKFAETITKDLGIDFDLQRETEINLSFNTTWLQNYYNQKPILDTFFSAIKPEKSLCFFYAKQTPLSDDPRRVIIGIGRIKHVEDGMEYNSSNQDLLRCMIWERNIQHSIRDDYKDGFIFPYIELYEKFQNDEKVNLEDYVIYGPEDKQLEFSYATEHVSHDTAKTVILQSIDVLKKIETLLNKSFTKEKKWLNDRLGEVWKLRGAYPGIGSALCAFGITNGNLLSYYLADFLKENDDPWDLVDKALSDPSTLPDEFKKNIGPQITAKWLKLPEERKSLLKLLSRFDLNIKQAIRFYIPEEREDSNIYISDADIIENPYLIYEKDRFSFEPINLTTIDTGTFPSKYIDERFPLLSPSAINGSTDPRRIRALIVNLLENSANEGHTLLPVKEVILKIRDIPLEYECMIDQDLLSIMKDFFLEEFAEVNLTDEVFAYQLNYISRYKDVISKSIKNRVNSLRLKVNADWKELLEEKLGTFDSSDLVEKEAREEKLSALKELAESRFSVLIGPAGTGKTTLLSTLCNQIEVKRAGVLLLAPTGKARVRMQQATGIPAYTIAQFLLKLNRYNPVTQTYLVLQKDHYEGVKTVIIDEASMLTESQFASLISSLKGVNRIILVGDPQQLPPIGAGRPFVDIVNYIKPKGIDNKFPKVEKGFIELTVNNRQRVENSISKEKELRLDVELANWFSGKPLDVFADSIFEKLFLNDNLPNIRFIEWNKPEELQKKLIKTIIEELNLEGISDQQGFETKTGGILNGDYVNYDRDSGSSIENWQIISPVKGNTFGVFDINRIIQKTFRSNMFNNVMKSFKLPKPMGAEKIIYGDKVINTINNSREYVYPKEGALEYIANGEIGVVIGEFKSPKSNYKGRPWKINVSFSSQVGYSYSYIQEDFGDEGFPTLELAYAITVHKSQGSEFGITFLILPNPCRLLSRELIYTALTRQKSKIIILHQGPKTEIIKYSFAQYSETARRFTNLFTSPKIIKINDKFYDQNLIHKTARGEIVRSKSEVIIADKLFAKDIDYCYEQSLKGNDNIVKYPDFTIENSETGVTYIWEHCGMLNDPNYNKKWLNKLEWYKSQGIIPYENYEKYIDDTGIQPEKVLIITQDDENGGIDSFEIEQLVNKIFDL